MLAVSARGWWLPVMSEEYGLQPWQLDDLSWRELAGIFDHLEMKAAEAKKAGNP